MVFHVLSELKLGVRFFPRLCEVPVHRTGPSGLVGTPAWWDYRPFSGTAPTSNFRRNPLLSLPVLPFSCRSAVVSLKRRDPASRASSSHLFLVPYRLLLSKTAWIASLASRPDNLLEYKADKTARLTVTISKQTKTNVFLGPLKMEDGQLFYVCPYEDLLTDPSVKHYAYQKNTAV